ncbi:FMN-binding negative transcriptional regulator [Agrococcus carbonis]|uniref:Negative transcriptional regulator, PaiB family n=1 Tax=Agrococcus carbonis TaxID=684552 RepID=A0A1H1S2E1_9MICO|nr:FMN-binding negative transcriptional regulator [Agrococcus carbonis]SDS41998.1 negative transcriptional regulator, PaiB family [Agrococcus carbonis]
MQPNPLYRIGAEAVREMLERAPWAQLVSHPASGPVASPSPVLLAPEDPGGDDERIVLETHLGRADARLHGLLQPREDGAPHTLLVIVAGDHGYISPSWYVGNDRGQVPTWNFEQANLTCEVELLDAQANLETLRRLVEHFESRYAPEHGVRLDLDDDGNRGMAMGTVGLRLTVRGFDAKSKMSQNKSEETRAEVLAHLDASNPSLAARMRAADADARVAG